MKQSLKKDRIVLRTKDYVASNEYFSLFLDNKTNIVWTDVAEDHNHSKYYENENYLPHNKKKGLLSFFYKLSQNIMFSYKLKVLQKSLQPSSIVLDYGSGDGHFAEFLKKQNIKNWKGRKGGYSQRISKKEMSTLTAKIMVFREDIVFCIKSAPSDKRNSRETLSNS